MAYDYQWLPTMGRVSPDPKLEEHYRAGIIAATKHLEGLCVAGADLPLFSWGKFSSPKNPAAVEMTKVIEAALATVEATAGAAKPDGSRRLAILTLAVRAAYMVRSGGFGEKGWALLGQVVRGGPVPAAPPAPTPPVGG